MEEPQNVPPELAELHAKSMRVEGIIAKKQTIASTIGTPEFQGTERFIPPTPDHPNYLKELVATTITSSRVKRVIERRSLPALERIHNSLQEEIAHRQQLLSDAAEYTVSLQELRELQGEGVLTNQSVIGMVEDALRKIDEELHSQPTIATRTSKVFSTNTYPSSLSGREFAAQDNERRIRVPEAIEANKLTVLRQLADGRPLSQLMDALNKDNNRPFTEERAERFIHGIFTKLYGRVTRGEADDEEVKTWQDIRGRVPTPQIKQVRDDFRDHISRVFHPTNSQVPHPERRVRDQREKKPIDPHELIKSVLDRIEKHGIKIGSDQHFIPRAAFEVFGVTQRSMRDSLEKGYINPLKREGNDYHPAFSVAEAIQLAVIQRYKGATKEQIEELPILIELELERWGKEHPNVISLT